MPTINREFKFNAHSVEHRLFVLFSDTLPSFPNFLFLVYSVVFSILFWIFRRDCHSVAKDKILNQNNPLSCVARRMISLP